LTANLQEDPQPAANSSRSELPDFPEFLRQNQAIRDSYRQQNNFRQDQRLAFNRPLLTI
jgi:hypothetical protein